MSSSPFYSSMQHRTFSKRAKELDSATDDSLFSSADMFKESVETQNQI
jgi:hypothetical protein